MDNNKTKMNSNNQEFMKRVKEVYDTQNIQGFLDFISNEEEKNKLLEAIDKAYENFPKTNPSYTT